MVCTREVHQDCIPSSDSKEVGILDVVHSYVCGPMSTVYLSGFEYYVIFIDDFSMKTWI